MGRLSDEMSNLRMQMRELTVERKRLVSRLGADSKRRRQETQEMLAGFHQERSEKVSPFLQELKEQRHRNTEFVRKLQQEAAELRAGFRREIDENARRRHEQTKDSVGERRDTVARQLSSWQQERSEQSIQLREELTAFRRNLLASLPDFQTLAATRSREVKNILSGVQSSLKNNRDELAEVSREGRTERQQFVHALRQEVAEISQKTQAMRAEVIADLATIRQALDGKLSPRQSAAPAATPRSAPAEAPPEQATASLEPADDLTQINGIGAVRARLLQASGIRTFTRLAQCSVEELQTVVNSPTIAAELPKWIAAAERMAFLK